MSTMFQSDPEGALYRIFLDAERSTKAHKWHHYFDAYEAHFRKFMGRPVRMIEIGVNRGGSLEMWRKYFGPALDMTGLDITPECAAFATDGVRVLIGDQADPDFLKRVLATTGPPDIVLDDGGHTANQQIVSFETLYPVMPDHGVYLVEDTHTSFWGGGFSDRKDGRTFMDFAFDRCRELHAWTMHREAFKRFGTPPAQRTGAEVPASDFCRTTRSITFYDSIVVFEKGQRSEPWHEIR